MKNIEIKKGGISIIGVLLLGVILIIVLSYFKINLKAVVENPETQSNFSYVGGVSKSLWNDYLKKPATYLWNDVFLAIFWKSFISNMENIRDNEPTDLENLAPQLNLN